METQAPSITDSAEFATIRQELDKIIRGSVDWFYWIAGLSLVNTVVYSLGISSHFVGGLGITQVIDSFMDGLAIGLGAGWDFVRLIGFVIDVLIAGMFIAFGILGSKRYRAPIIIGMVLYAMDGIILLLFQDFFSAGFHGLALLGISGSLRAISELEKLETVN